METKRITVFIDTIPSFYITITRETTIAEILHTVKKKSINKFVRLMGYSGHTIFLTPQKVTESSGIDESVLMNSHWDELLDCKLFIFSKGQLKT